MGPTDADQPFGFGTWRTLNPDPSKNLEGSGTLKVKTIVRRRQIEGASSNREGSSIEKCESVAPRLTI
jgi:hypothetical protein